MNKKRIAVLLIVVAAVLVVGICAFFLLRQYAADDIAPDEAQELIAQAFDDMSNARTQDTAQYVLDHIQCTVTDVYPGKDGAQIAVCRIQTIHAGDVLLDNLPMLMQVDTVDDSGRQMVSTKLKITINQTLLPLMQEAEPLTVDACEIPIYENENGYVVYTSDEVVNTCTGGLIDAIAQVKATEELTLPDGSVIVPQTNLKNAVTECVLLTYDNAQPANGGALQSWFNELKQKFYLNFIEANRYQYLTRGLLTTLEITFFALILGIVGGFLIAVVRATWDKNKDIPPKNRLLRGLLAVGNAICRLYLTVIRGTPVVVQLLIIYYVIFASANVNKIFVASLAFGLNSAAYVAEIVRSGIMSIDVGQMEAGRSLGLNYVQSMTMIILPQAFKTVLPALANEFIVLLKETSISGYIAIQDLTKGGDIIRSRTYDAFMPLIAVALVYLAVVVLLSSLVTKLERRLRRSDRG